VTVSQDDVKLVAREFDLDNKAADAKLRENGGDLCKTLISLLHDGLPSEG
jgi:NACalpha-BTF3-like transcription factor